MQGGLLLILLALPACSLFGPQPGAADGDVVARAAPENTLLVSNGTEEAIYYFAVGMETRHLVDWVPSVTGSNVIASGQQHRVEVTGEEREDVVLYWWTAVQSTCPVVPIEGDSGPCYAPGPIQTLEVRR